MNTMEETFVKTFIARDLRERWLVRLQSEKTRPKLLNRLAHRCAPEFDQRYVYDKNNPPPQVAVQIQHVLREWKQSNPQQLCHSIAIAQRRDGQMMSLPDAEEDYGLTAGAIMMLIPNMFAYYHTERGNLNKQPFYLLFRP